MTKQTKATLVGALAAAAVVGTVAIAGNVTLPNTFTAGTPIRSAEVNANFQAVKTANDDNQTQLTALQARVTALEASAKPAMKTVTFLNAVVLAANPSNLASVTFTAPSAGYIQASALANCGVPTGGAAAVSFALALEDSATSFTSGYDSQGWVYFPAGGNTMSRAMIPVLRSKAVPAGQSTIYLNAWQSGAAGNNCHGTVSVVFTPTQLP